MASRVTRSRRPRAAVAQPELQPRPRWTAFLTGILADLMVQQVHKVNKHGGSFTNQAWKSICTDFFNQTGLRWDMERLKSRYIVLKKHHAIVKSLLDQTEFSWDESTGAVTASDEAWNRFISEHPDAETIRSSGCPIYKQLCTIFSQPATNGKHVFSTEFGPNGLSSIPKLEPLSTVPEYSRSESDEAEDDNAFQPSMRGATCGRKRGRKGIDDAIAAAILEMAAASKLRAAAAKQQNARYNIASCIKELDEMQGVEQRLYFAALDLFNNPNARETFLCLKAGKRLAWLERKCASSPDYLS